MLIAIDPLLLRLPLRYVVYLLRLFIVLIVTLLLLRPLLPLLLLPVYDWRWCVVVVVVTTFDVRCCCVFPCYVTPLLFRCCLLPVGFYGYVDQTLFVDYVLLLLLTPLLTRCWLLLLLLCVDRLLWYCCYIVVTLFSALLVLTLLLLVLLTGYVLRCCYCVGRWLLTICLPITLRWCGWLLGTLLLRWLPLLFYLRWFAFRCTSFDLTLLLLFIVTVYPLLRYVYVVDVYVATLLLLLLLLITTLNVVVTFVGYVVAVRCWYVVVYDFVVTLFHYVPIPFVMVFTLLLTLTLTTPVVRSLPVVITLLLLPVVGVVPLLLDCLTLLLALCYHSLLLICWRCAIGVDVVVYCWCCCRWRLFVIVAVICVYCIYWRYCCCYVTLCYRLLLTLYVTLLRRVTLILLTHLRLLLLLLLVLPFDCFIVIYCCCRCCCYVIVVVAVVVGWLFTCYVTLRHLFRWPRLPLRCCCGYVAIVTVLRCRWYVARRLLFVCAVGVAVTLITFGTDCYRCWPIVRYIPVVTLPHVTTLVPLLLIYCWRCWRDCCSFITFVVGPLPVLLLLTVPFGTFDERCCPLRLYPRFDYPRWVTLPPPRCYGPTPFDLLERCLTLPVDCDVITLTYPVVTRWIRLPRLLIYWFTHTAHYVYVCCYRCVVLRCVTRYIVGYVDCLFTLLTLLLRTRLTLLRLLPVFDTLLVTLPLRYCALLLLRYVVELICCCCCCLLLFIVVVTLLHVLCRCYCCCYVTLLLIVVIYWTFVVECLFTLLLPCLLLYWRRYIYLPLRCCRCWWRRCPLRCCYRYVAYVALRYRVVLRCPIPLLLLRCRAILPFTLPLLDVVGCVVIDHGVIRLRYTLLDVALLNYAVYWPLLLIWLRLLLLIHPRCYAVVTLLLTHWHCCYCCRWPLRCCYLLLLTIVNWPLLPDWPCCPLLTFIGYCCWFVTITRCCCYDCCRWPVVVVVVRCYWRCCYTVVVIWLRVYVPDCCCWYLLLLLLPCWRCCCSFYCYFCPTPCCWRCWCYVTFDVTLLLLPCWRCRLLRCWPVAIPHSVTLLLTCYRWLIVVDSVYIPTFVVVVGLRALLTVVLICYVVICCCYCYYRLRYVVGIVVTLLTIDVTFIDTRWVVDLLLLLRWPLLTYCYYCYSVVVIDAVMCRIVTVVHSVDVVVTLLIAVTVLPRYVIVVDLFVTVGYFPRWPHLVLLLLIVDV